MKKAKSSILGQAGAQKLAKATGEQRKRSGMERLEPEGLRVDFGGVNFAEFPPIDAMLMPTLSAALRPLPLAICEAFRQRGILSHRVSNGLIMARFLSFTLLPARAAQETTGVRASILLADANRLQGDWVDKFIGDSNDVFNVGQRFHDFAEAFLDRAQELKVNRKFRAVMHSMCDPAECLKQLGLCEFWNPQQRFDLISDITDYGLQECDVLHD
jgi:hypothetical protein